jgi:arylsulfatase A-like enzyme
MRIRFVSAVALLGVLVGGAEPLRAEPPRPNLILIVVDAWRADRFGARRNREPMMPFVDSLAARGYVFERAYAASSCTAASVASLLTGRYPAHHGVRCTDGALADGATTLASTLAGHGYARATFTASPLFAGADAGTDVYRHLKHSISLPVGAEYVNAEAIRWLDERARRSPADERPAFLHLHYIDVLAPWAPPPSYMQRITGHFERHLEKGLMDAIPRANRLYLEAAHRPLSAVELAEVTTVYDASVMAFDSQMRSLFGLLEERRVLQNAIVVITADHGEDLGEHATVGHGATLWETTTRVPLLIVTPRRASRSEPTEPVSLVDVAPTLLELLGIPPASGIDGRSLLPTLRRADEPWSWETMRWSVAQWWTGPEHDLHSESPGASASSGRVVHARAVVLGTDKAIVRADGTRAYFDLAADPKETNPLALDGARRARLDAGK